MSCRRIGVAFVVVGAIAYLAGFATEYALDYGAAGESTQRLIEWSWDAAFFLPLVAVGVAAYLWPRWWVVLAIFGFMFVFPFGVHELELATELKEPLGQGCDPCIDTAFLSVMAFPAVVIGIGGLGVARRRRRVRHRVLIDDAV